DSLDSGSNRRKHGPTKSNQRNWNSIPAGLDYAGSTGCGARSEGYSSSSPLRCRRVAYCWRWDKTLRNPHCSRGELWPDAASIRVNTNSLASMMSETYEDVYAQRHEGEA